MIGCFLLDDVDLGRFCVRLFYFSGFSVRWFFGNFLYVGFFVCFLLFMFIKGLAVDFVVGVIRVRGFRSVVSGNFFYNCGLF